MKYLILIIAIFFVSNVYAQEANTVRYNTEHKNCNIASKDSTVVTGRVIHEYIGKSLVAQPMIGALVLFYDKKDSEIILTGKYRDFVNLCIDGSYTKKDGTFEVRLPYGEYLVESSGIGVDYEYETIILNTKNVDLGDIILKPSSREEFNDIKITRIKRRDHKK